MKGIKKILLGIVLLLAILIAVGVCLLGTVTGLNLILNGITSYIPGLEIASINNSWSKITLKQVSYHIQGLAINVGEINLSLDPSYFRHLQLCINNIELNDVVILLKTQDIKSFILGRINNNIIGINTNTIYPFILHTISLHNIYMIINNTHIKLNSFNSGISFGCNNLFIMPTHITNMLVVLPELNQVAKSQELNIGRQLLHIAHSIEEQKNNYHKKDLMAISSDQLSSNIIQDMFVKPFLLDFTKFKFPLNVTVKKLIIDDIVILNGNKNLLINRFYLSTVIQDQYIKIRLLNIESPQGCLKVYGHTTVTGKLPLFLVINSILNLDTIKGEKIKINIAGFLREELSTSIKLDGPITAKLDMKTSMSHTIPRIMLSINIPEEQWFLNKKPVNRVHDITLNINGTTSECLITMKSVLSNRHIPTDDTAYLSRNKQVYIENSNQYLLLHLSPLYRKSDLTALFNCQHILNYHNVNWYSNHLLFMPDKQADIKNIITNNIYSLISVPIANTKNNLNNNYWNTKYDCLNKHNYWYENIYGATCDLDHNDCLGLKNNIINAKVKLHDDIDINTFIDIPVLGSIIPGISGAINGIIKLDEKNNILHLLANINASQLHYNSWVIHRIMLQSDLTGIANIHGYFNMQIDQLKKDNIELRKLKLTVIGDEKQHQLKILIHGKSGSVQLQINGSFDSMKQYWRGHISHAFLVTSIGKWRLMQKMSLNYQNLNKKIIIGSHYWQNANSKFCIPQDIEAVASWRENFILKQLDLIMLKPLVNNQKITANNMFLTQETVLSNYKAKYSSSLQDKLLLSDNNNFNMQQQKLVTHIMPIICDRLSLHLVLNEGILCLEWIIKIVGYGQLNGHIDISDLKHYCNLSGNIKINNLSLSLFNYILSSNQNVNGVVNTTVLLHGNIKHPRIYGKLEINGLIIKSTLIPFIMTNSSHLSLMFDGSKSFLKGLISTTHGKFNVNGNIRWDLIKDWHSNIIVQGKQIRTYITPTLQLDVSPDIICNFTSKALSIKGEVATNWARIEIKDLPETTVAISSDEVVLDRKIPSLIVNKNASSINISTDLLVHISDDVTINAFGIKASLKGDVQVKQNRNDIKLNGQIHVLSGKLHVYGQNLVIRTGQLVFSGPLDRTYLNIQVSHSPELIGDDITAGIRVIGIINHLKMEIFSDPIKSHQEVISYLLFGRDMNSTVSDRNVITSMLIRMGFATIDQFICNLGKLLGVNDLELNTQGIGKSSQVVISGYITPDIQLKYGVGIFDSQVTLKLRYLLMSKLYLELDSGNSQTWDLLYRISF